MKKLLLFFLLLLSFEFSFAQSNDSLSLKEQERRRQNIEAGNPFKKFGYTPKIATLSKGKYLEWHDLDSIVRIGSYSFHVKKKKLWGMIVLPTRTQKPLYAPRFLAAGLVQ